jgi:hypothetical protein
LTDVRLFWSGVLVLNAVWMILLQGVSAKVAAVLGTGVAILMIAQLRSGGRHQASNAILRSPLSDNRRALASLLTLFLLPALSFAYVPRLAFWRLDGRLWLVLAWFVSTIVFESANTAGEGTVQHPTAEAKVPATIGLFMLWASAVWLTVVSDLGVGQFIVHMDRSVARLCSGDPLTTIFSIWESAPASQHLFLGWRGAQDFAAHTVYENHVHPYLFAMYAWVSVVRAVTGRPLFVASNSTAILDITVMLGAVTVLLARAGTLRRCRGVSGMLVLFSAVGFTVTTWRMWDDLFRFNSDNPYPLLGAVFVIVYALFVRPIRRRLVILAGTLFVALSPIHLPMLLLAVGSIFGRTGKGLRQLVKRNRTLIYLSAVATGAGVLAIALPWALVASKGYHGQASTFMFRSGLDGSTTYFTNIVQAVWSACPLNCCGSPRPILNLVFPAFVPLAVYLWPAHDSREVRRLGGFPRLLLFLAVPYVVSAIFFPQSVSIHPYLYDHLLIIPAVACGAVAMTSTRVRERLRGPGLLVFLLLSAFVIMSNLVSIAQGLARLP